MNPTKWKTIKETFSAVLELPLSERSVFLSKSDEEIRREVEKLLSTFAEAENFISLPLAVEKGWRKNKVQENFVGKHIDDYVILEKIGEGGMGMVFLAEQRGDNFTQKVALKLIKRGMDTNPAILSLTNLNIDSGEFAREIRKRHENQNKTENQNQNIIRFDQIFSDYQV